MVLQGAYCGMNVLRVAVGITSSLVKSLIASAWGVPGTSPIAYSLLVVGDSSNHGASSSGQKVALMKLADVVAWCKMARQRD